MIRIVLIMALLGLTNGNAWGAVSPEALSLWKTLNGTNLNPSSSVAEEITEKLNRGERVSAAMLAARSANSSFVTSVVRKLVTPLAGREINPAELAGDFVLTWMIAALNDIPMDQLFLSDLRYSTTRDVEAGDVIESVNRFLEINVADQQLMTALNRGNIRNYMQSYLSDSDQALGVLTSTQYAKASFEAGTNRRPVKKIVENFLCIDNIEQIKNFSISDSWVGRDIPRGPDPSAYLNNCMGCHAGMDAARGAFAGYDFVDDTLQWIRGVQPKMNNDQGVFPAGYLTDSHRWQHLGWMPIAPDQVGQEFTGARPFVKMIVESSRFYQCMVDRGIETLCPKATVSPGLSDEIANKFSQHKNLTPMLAEVAARVCVKE